MTTDLTVHAGAIATALADRYRFERELGTGGTATVYLAHDHKHGRDVAIKVLHADLAASVGRERFLREIRLAAKLSHPHILALYDSGEAAGALYYVMPNVEGQSLRRRLDDGPLPIEEAVRVAEEVASALDHAHRHGVVHRDIKPANIMLQDGHALVTDFGIGTLVSDASGEALTQAGMSIGTPAYMSPEQAAGETVDGRSDLYSLGCVLYETLVGEPPFTGRNVQAVIAKRFVQVPADVTALREGVPRAVARAVQKALTRAPIDRYHTATEFLAALRESAAGPEPKSTAPPQSVAVLPFEYFGGNGDDYFGDGIAEEIINVLTQIEGLHVAARTSCFAFRGKDEDLRVVGEKLGVRHVLEGSVRRAGQRLRITAQLIDATDGYHLWSERYDRELVDVFAVQDEIASAIAAKLRVTFDDSRGRSRAPATPVQLEAYDLFLRGRAALAGRVRIREAAECFERVITLDPAHARAHAGLAEALRLLAQYGEIPPAEAVPRAKAALARALALDPELAEAMSTAAAIAISFEWDPDAAIRQWERALALQPRLSEARAMYAEYGLLFARNDAARAVAEARRAMRDDPRSSICAAIAAQTLGMAGHLEEAYTHAMRAVELDPQSFLTLTTAALVLCERGDAGAALPHATRASKLLGRSPLSVAVCAVAEALRGDRDRAEAYYREVLARAEVEFVSKLALAMTAMAAGHGDDAMGYALAAARAHELLAPSLVRWRSMPFRAHPRFAELVEAFGG